MLSFVYYFNLFVRQHTSVQTRIVDDEHVQIRGSLAPADTLDEVSDDRKTCASRQGTDVDDHVRYAFQTLPVEGGNNAASTDYRVVRPKDLNRYYHLPVGECSNKSIRVCIRPRRLVLWRTRAVFPDEQCSETRGCLVEASDDGA